MKRVLFLFFFLTTYSLHAQNEVEWTFTYDSDSESIQARANINEGWHLYSQFLSNELGPIPTSFEYIPNDNYSLVGSTNEPKAIKAYDENFEGEMHFFEDEVVFTQQIEIKESTDVNGVVTYMVCNDVMCMPPVDVEFTITITN